MWNPETRHRFRERVERLTTTTAPQWGRLSAAGMLAHLNDTYRMAVGELMVKPVWLPIRYPPLRQLIVYLLPMPKGAPTAPELIARCAQAELQTERQAFYAWMDRLGEMSAECRLEPHPVFGNLSHKEYGVLIARHSDHHFRQFGL